MKLRLLAVCLALLVLLGGLTGCSPELPEVYVQSVAVLTGYGSIGGVNASAGVVISQDEITVERDMDREIKELFVTAGQTVVQGEALFSYNVEHIDLEVDKIELEIEQMTNSITDIDNQITLLEKEKNTVSKDDQLAYTVQIQALQTDKKELQYNITTKRREMNTLLAEAQDSQVVAPSDGRVREINENGTDSMGNPKPYIVIVRSGAYRIKGKLNELNQGDISIGTNVLIRSRADETMTWNGVVTMIDTESPSTGDGSGYMLVDDTTYSSNYPFYVDLAVTDGLMLGQHVYIEPAGETAGADTMRLDASFLQGDAEQGFWVWAEKDGKLEQRKVTAENYNELTNTYEIIEGLLPEDYIAFPEEGMQSGSPTTHNAPEPSETEWEEFPDEGAADYEEFPETDGYEEIIPDDVFTDDFASEFAEDGDLFSEESTEPVLSEDADGGVVNVG